MKRARHPFCLQISDRLRKRAIERAQEIGRRDVSLQGKAGDLGERVDAGVSAAGTLRQGRFADNAAERGLQFALDGALAGLNLPTVEIGAVVGDGQFPILSLFRIGLDRVCHGNLSCQ